jgi:hypothetical protein
MRQAGYVACMRENTNAYNILIEKSEGRPRHRWEDNIIMGLREIG